MAEVWKYIGVAITEPKSKILHMHAALCIMCMLRKAFRQSVVIIVSLGVVIDVGDQEFGTNAGGKGG